MTTETKIAERNIKVWVKQDGETPLRMLAFKFNCISHKASCQRFLGFLERNDNEYLYGKMNEDISLFTFQKKLQEKITDLKNAIKKYDGAGI